MHKRMLFIPLIRIVLGIAFFVISFFIKHIHDNSKLIKRKLCIGILIINLTTMLNTPVWPQDNKDVLHNPLIEFYNTGKPDIVLDFPFQCTIQGKIHIAESNAYSYCITDLRNNFIDSGEIKAKDGTYDGENEEFIFTINSHIPPGEYRLYIYDKVLDNPEQNPDEDYIGLYELTITKNKIMCYLYFY